MSQGPEIQDVNIAFGDEASKMLYEASKQTYANRPDLLVEFHESFSGARAIPASIIKDPQNTYMNLGFDGVGTKVEVSERLDDHSVVAFDLFAMVCDDAVVRGAEPIALGSILDVSHLGHPDDPESLAHAKSALTELCVGYIAAAKAAGVVVVNGETAELGDRITGYDGWTYNFNYNWGAAVLWLAHRDRLLTGKQLRPGDTLVGLGENGFRSNGITAVREAMQRGYGADWHKQVDPSLGEQTLGRLVQTPSTIYTKLITDLTGGYDLDKRPLAHITGVANITGGGQPSKIGRMLEPAGLGATIDNPYNFPPIMTRAQEILNLSDEEAYGKWHGGVGMVVATSQPGRVQTEAMRYRIAAKRIGEVTDEPGIRILNKGVQQQEEWLTFSSGK